MSDQTRHNHECRLLQLAQTGEQRALERLFNDTWARAHTRALAILRNDEDAHDAVQQAALLAIRELGQCRGRFASWFVAIAERVSLTMYKNRQKEAERKAEIAERNPREHAPRPDERIEHKEALDLLAQALENLSEQQRQVCTLMGMEGVSRQDVAEILGIPTANAAGATFGRGKRAIAEFLTQCGHTIRLRHTGRGKHARKKRRRDS